MSNVIEVDFTSDNNCGYMIDEGSIHGVYCADIAAINDNELVYIGKKVGSGIEYPAQASMDEINEFCLMWLLIFNPEVIVE